MKSAIRNNGIPPSTSSDHPPLPLSFFSTRSCNARITGPIVLPSHTTPTSIGAIRRPPMPLSGVCGRVARTDSRTSVRKSGMGSSPILSMSEPDPALKPVAEPELGCEPWKSEYEASKIAIRLPVINLKSSACLERKAWCEYGDLGRKLERGEAYRRSPYSTRHHPMPLTTMSNHGSSTNLTCLTLPMDIRSSRIPEESRSSSTAIGNVSRRSPTRR